MEKIKKVIKSDKCLKLICAAGNENLKEIERLCFVYAKAGFNMVDLCAKSEVIKAAKKGMQLAGINMAICLSVGLKDDIHLSKVIINNQKCNKCKQCINVCEQDALYEENGKILTDEKKCIGCMKCLEICADNAIISEHKYKSPCEMLLPLLSYDIDCVEFHCSSANQNEITDAFCRIKSIYNGLISICLDRSKMGDEQIISVIKKIIEIDENVIIQADGKPMSGGKDDFNSTIQTVAFSQLIRNAGIDNFLLLSGGTNSKSSQLASLCSVKIDGVALGSYARKIIKEYISKEDFYENPQLIDLAVNKAKNLANEIMQFLILSE